MLSASFFSLIVPGIKVAQKPYGGGRIAALIAVVVGFGGRGITQGITLVIGIDLQNAPDLAFGGAQQGVYGLLSNCKRNGTTDLTAGHWSFLISILRPRQRRCQLCNGLTNIKEMPDGLPY